MRRLLAVILLAVTVGGCGGSGGSGDVDAVREVVELYFAREEPRGCDVQTDRFLKNSEDQADLAAARRQCRKDESGPPSSKLEQLGFVPSRSAAASKSTIDGATASAKATLAGGDLDGRVIDVSLVEQGGAWRIDRLDGLEIDAALRQKADRAFDAYLRGALRREVSADRFEATVACVLARVRREFPNKRLAMHWEGQLPPDTLSGAIKLAAARCLGGRTVAGTGYEVTLPRGWKKDKPSPGSSEFRPDLEMVDGAQRDGLRLFAVVGIVSDVPDWFKLERFISGSRPGRKARRLGTVKPATLGGVEAITLTIPSMNSKGRKVRTRQIMAIRDETAYSVTLVTGVQDFEDEDESFDALLASWRWR